jgi:hypothetical protein
MVEHARELLKAAMQSEHKLKQYLVMSPEQWATESKDTKKKKWWEVLCRYCAASTFWERGH